MSSEKVALFLYGVIVGIGVTTIVSVLSRPSPEAPKTEVVAPSYVPILPRMEVPAPPVPPTLVTYTYTLDQTGKRKPVCSGNSFGYPEIVGNGMWVWCLHPVKKEPMRVFLTGMPIQTFPVEMP